MTKKGFMSLIAALVLGTALTAQVRVQPVKDVHTVVIEDAVSLKVYFDRDNGTELEVSSADSVARVSKGIMTMDGATNAVLHMAADSPITHFRVQNAASLELIGPIDCGDRQFTVDAEDAGKVKMTKTSPTDTVRTGYVILHSQDGSRIVGDVPVLLTAYTLYAEDNSYIELPSIDLKPGTDTDDKTYEMITKDRGKVKVLGHVAYFQSDQFVLTNDGVLRIDQYRVGHNSKANRDWEFNFLFGFNNWGSNPFSAFGGVIGDAAATYHYHAVVSLDHPVLNRRHFGLYVGLGIQDHGMHFENPLVNMTSTGFQAGTASSIVQPTAGTFDNNNWDSYFNHLAVTVPVTFSFEPWKYSGFCIRLSAIPGITIGSYLEQRYNANKLEVNVRDRQSRKRTSPFMLDARVTLMYGDIGLYVQTATVPLFKQGFETLYPVGFGFLWTMTGR